MSHFFLQNVTSTPTSRGRQCRRTFIRPLPALGVLLLCLAVVAPLQATAVSSPGEPTLAAQDDKKKKRKKQRGKVVKATVVPSEPAPSEAEAATATTATTEGSVAAAPEGSSTTDPKAAKKAEKEARQQAKKEAAAKERADREASKRADEEARATERAEQREATQARDSAKADSERQAREMKAAEKAAAKSAAASKARKTAPEPQPAPKVTSAAKPPAVKTEAAKPTAVETKPTATPAPAPTARAATAPTADRTRSPSPDVSSPDISERIEVREVLLDVLVTDRKGNTIEGLDKSAFQVTEDGKPVEVTSLVYYGGAEELQSAGIEETRTDRYFILLFHDQAQAAPFLRAAQMDNGRWARKWIEGELQPNDQVAVLGYDVRLKVYQDFTTDPLILAQAVDAAVRGQKEPDRWRTREADPARDGSPSLLINLPKGQTLSRETRKLQQALELIGRASEGIIGRKNLMLFSAGFGDIDDIGVWTPDPRYYPPMKESLNTGNVAVYSIDLLGSRRGNPGARDINDGLSALSTDTGGHYYSTYANVMAPLRNVSEDNLGYYLLSYRSEFESGTSGYREVKVKVDNPTGGKKLKVKGRKGYRFGT